MHFHFVTELGSYAQGQGHNQVKGQIVPRIVLLIYYGSKLMKLHKKIKHNEKVCRAHDLGSYTQGQESQSGQRSKSCLSNNSKTTEANLMKLHRKIEHNEKVCRAQELGFYAQDKGHNQVKGQMCLKLCCS